jgi:hypothetical protein
MRYAILFLMVVTLGVNIWVWSYTLEKSPFSPLPPSPSPTTNNNQANNSCAEFQNKFGTSAEELVNYINQQPESAQVMIGYRNLYGKITGLMPNSYFPLIIRLNGQGKVAKVECLDSTETRDYKVDLDFSIPETDFAQIVRYRESLETSQAQTYLQNLKTNPTEAKQKILVRIQGLE